MFLLENKSMAKKIRKTITTITIFAIGVTFGAFVPTFALEEVGEQEKTEETPIIVTRENNNLEFSPLGKLIVLDELFGKERPDIQYTSNQDDSQLGKLIVLNSLFREGGTNNENVSDLGKLIVLNSLFGNGQKNADGQQNISELEKLIVLDGLFN